METDKFAPDFEPLQFSENQEEEQILRYATEPFFTNLNQSVFGSTFLPPEVIGALCSRASRAKDDLRVIFAREFVKPFIEAEGEYSNALRALVDFLHKYPAELIFSNPKAREFYITWLSQFGDDSIAQEAGTHLFYSGISQLGIKQIEDMRIGIAPIEKSTRYVDYSFRVNGKFRYYTDPTLAERGLEQEYRLAMDNLFETYSRLLAEYMDFLRKKYPGEEEKVLKTKAFDTVRTVLPTATLSQLALFGNGQAFEYMLNRGLEYHLGEIRWTAKRAQQELNKIIPAFLRRVDTEESEQYRKYLSERGERIRGVLSEIGWSDELQQSLTEEPSVKLLSYSPDGEDRIIAGLIYNEKQEPFGSVLEKVRQLSAADKERILQEVLKDREFRYYKIPRAFEFADLCFEVLMNIGAWRDLHRHRMHTQSRQLFTVQNGFDIPEGLREAGLANRFVSAVLKAEEVFKMIESVDEHIAQYCTTLSHRVRFLQKQNMRAFFWESELRTIPQGHPDYRKIEQEKIRQVQRIYPLVSKYLLIDMADYDFARRGESSAIQRKEEELKQYFGAK